MSDLIAEDQLKNLSGTGKLEEYYEIKRQMREFTREISDLTKQHPSYSELKKKSDEVAKLRKEIKDDPMIKEITEKKAILKERLDLTTELIRLELIDNAQEEIAKDGKKLKLIYVVKEVKDTDN